MTVCTRALLEAKRIATVVHLKMKSKELTSVHFSLNV